MILRFLLSLILLGCIEVHFNQHFLVASDFYVLKNDTNKVSEILKQADDLIDKGDFAQALDKIDSVIIISETLNYDRGIVLAKSATVDILLIQKQADSALSLIENTLEQYPNNKEKLRFYSSQATAYNMKGLSEEAIQSFEKALTFIEDLPAEKQDRSKAATLVNMASAYHRLGNKAKTLENYLQGLEFAEASNDTSFLLVVLNNLGDSYNTYAEYERAEFYLERALSIAGEKNFKPDLLRIHLNLANVYTNIGKTDLALEFYQKALELNKVVRPDTPPFQIIYNLGELYLKLDEFEKARSSFMESLQYCMDMNIPIGLYFNYTGLGQVSEATSKPEDAIEWYEKALEVAESLGQTPFIAQLNERLYAINKSLGNSQKALTALENFKAMSDSLNTLDTESTLADLESRLELKRQTDINALLEEKQTQQENQLALRKILIIAAIVVITLLITLYYFSIQIGRERKKINSVLRTQKEELEDLDANKNKFFAVVAHDLRSPLASMQGILQLIRQSEMSIEEIRKLSDELEPMLQKNIDTMNDLLVWSRNQMSGVSLNSEEINCHEAVRDLIAKHELQLKAKKIEVDNHIEKSFTISADKNAILLIIRNLLVNAIKFTNLDGRIVFDAYTDNEFCYIIIKDNGIGIPVDIQSKLFSNETKSRSGTNQEEGSGFGLRLSKEFAVRMNGDLIFESVEGEGTTFYLKLPNS